MLGLQGQLLQISIFNTKFGQLRLFRVILAVLLLCRFFFVFYVLFAVVVVVFVFAAAATVDVVVLALPAAFLDVKLSLLQLLI